MKLIQFISLSLVGDFTMKSNFGEYNQSETNFSLSLSLQSVCTFLDLTFFSFIQTGQFVVNFKLPKKMG